MNKIFEWGLAGQRFGTVVAWFLIGGDLYTAYTFIAVPGALYAKGAIGFFAVPYTIIAWPLFFVVLPKFWTVAKSRGYVTASDFVRDRFGSSTLALLVAITGILATMPYIALQMVGIEVAVQQMGFNGEIALVIAFVILAAYTYYSGLRAPAMIAIVKDTMIYITAFVALIVNLVLCIILTPIFQALKVAQGQDATTPNDYAEVETVPATAPAAGN